MKIRTLFLASLALCAMASCSKDDGVSTPQDVDAYLSIAANSVVQTKASTAGTDDVGTGNEAVVNTLTAYVFSADGNYVIRKKVTAGDDDAITEDKSINGATVKSITAIKGIHVKVTKPATDGTASATTFKVYLIANTDPGTAATIDAFKALLTETITNYPTVGASSLPMHSEELNVSSIFPSSETNHVLNWYKNGGCTQNTVSLTGTTAAAIDKAATAPTDLTTVVMTRAISRVQIESLSASFSGQYASATFTIDSIYVANVRNNATVMGIENPSASYFRGAPSAFTVIQNLIEPTGSTNSMFLKVYTSVSPALSLASGGTLSSTQLGFRSYINANIPTPKIVGTASIAYSTRLIISGNFKVGGVIRHKYFHIPLVDTDASKNVLSNKIYKITATITGEGNDNPDEILDNACINFKISVADWNVVNQSEGDLN